MPVNRGTEALRLAFFADSTAQIAVSRIFIMSRERECSLRALGPGLRAFWSRLHALGLGLLALVQAFGVLGRTLSNSQLSLGFLRLVCELTSREAASEYSPGRQPWVGPGTEGARNRRKIWQLFASGFRTLVTQLYRTFASPRRNTPKPEAWAPGTPLIAAKICLFRRSDSFRTRFLWLFLVPSSKNPHKMRGDATFPQAWVLR